MTARKKTPELEGTGSLANLAETFEGLGREQAPKVSRPTAKTKSKRGPDPDPASLRSQVAEGEARFLKVALPTAMHKRLHVMAVETDRTVSDLVAEALAAHYARLGK